MHFRAQVEVSGLGKRPAAFSVVTKDGRRQVPSICKYSQTFRDVQALEAQQSTRQAQCFCHGAAVLWQRETMCIIHDIVMKVLVTQSCQLSATIWTVACQAPSSKEFSRQEY